MKPQSLEATVAGRTFTLACGADERDDLEAAIALVSERVDEAYAQASNSTSERLLLLAALNLAHDLRRLRQARGELPSTSDENAINALKRRIEQSLG